MSVGPPEPSLPTLTGEQEQLIHASYNRFYAEYLATGGEGQPDPRLAWHYAWARHVLPLQNFWDEMWPNLGVMLAGVEDFCLGMTQVPGMTQSSIAHMQQMAEHCARFRQIEKPDVGAGFPR